MSMIKPIPRLLLIEDSNARIQQFRDWLPEGVVLIVTASAGRAIGTLQHSLPYDFAGIMLDHDLDQQVINETEKLFSGTNVVDSLIKKIDKEIPVLIHSINAVGAARMQRKLCGAGFDVTINPMTNLTNERFEAWLDNVLELWEYRQEDD
ncbi:cyclic-phosphate processing receiver domain-containing protein [Nitrosomonas sp. wSCUT-2]